MTAASVTTSSAAMSRIEAGIATGRSTARGAQRAASTSRSRLVSTGNSLVADPGPSTSRPSSVQPYLGARSALTSEVIPRPGCPPYGLP